MQIFRREIIEISQTLLLIKKKTKPQYSHIYRILLPLNRINYE